MMDSVKAEQLFRQAVNEYNWSARVSAGAAADRKMMDWLEASALYWAFERLLQADEEYTVPVGEAPDGTTLWQYCRDGYVWKQCVTERGIVSIPVQAIDAWMS